jgi:hypothetical protein
MTMEVAEMLLTTRSPLWMRMKSRVAVSVAVVLKTAIVTNTGDLP